MVVRYEETTTADEILRAAETFNADLNEQGQDRKRREVGD